MRRLLSLVLLLAFGLPTAAPAFGLSSDADSHLPACCRRNGAHHCMQSPAAMEAIQHGPRFTTPVNKCPYCPASTTPAQHQDLAFHASGVSYSALRSHRTVLSQIAAQPSTAEESAHRQRGPPANRPS